MAIRSALSLVLLVVPVACASPPAQPSGLTPEDEAAIRGMNAKWSANAAANRFIDNLDF